LHSREGSQGVIGSSLETVIQGQSDELNVQPYSF
jgi:hypothetical protein